MRNGRLYLIVFFSVLFAMQTFGGGIRDLFKSPETSIANIEEAIRQADWSTAKQEAESMRETSTADKVLKSEIKRETEFLIKFFQQVERCKQINRPDTEANLVNDCYLRGSEAAGRIPKKLHFSSDFITFINNAIKAVELHGSTSNEAVEWAMYGIKGQSEIDRWKKAGFDRSSAQSWHKSSFSPEEAAGWQNAGIATWAATKWKENGFSPVQAKTWKEYGFDKAEYCIGWRDAGFGPDEAKEWNGQGVLPDVAKEWKSAGFDVAQALPWIQASYYIGNAPLDCAFIPAEIGDWEALGFNAESAAPWKVAGLKPEAAKLRARNLKTKCNASVATLVDLHGENPYDIVGKCYEVSGVTFQLLAKSQALYSTKDSNGNTSIILLDFGTESAPPNEFYGIAKGIGAYKYSTTSGAIRIVAKLAVIETISRE